VQQTRAATNVVKATDFSRFILEPILSPLTDVHKASFKLLTCVFVKSQIATEKSYVLHTPQHRREAKLWGNLTADF
jgi:hypothetical protein